MNDQRKERQKKKGCYNLAKLLVELAYIIS